ncbi:OmpA/MotB domain protein [Nocardioides sp. CF8]|uniref:OmpA/MotB domain protein n=1 Tax=Nocardioides sp. CF8 TaxID=110319 RepID=UPI00033003B8|nr:OmpA/MotB domain protein [Nocardioides sp. CF8]EON24300.1 OmpA/MotB domain protein [Nocardioides sp. CF8]
MPPATSGSLATFAFTDTDATAVFDCRLDAGAWTSCSSPKTYIGLSHGSHTVNIRAVDGAGNTSAGTSTTWTVDATSPTATMTFPTATRYNLTGWATGCGTPATGDVCGTASDVGSGLTTVAVSIRRASTNSYWDGNTFAAASETWLDATGTTPGRMHSPGPASPPTATTPCGGAPPTPSATPPQVRST